MPAIGYVRANFLRADDFLHFVDGRVVSDLVVVRQLVGFVDTCHRNHRPSKALHVHSRYVLIFSPTFKTCMQETADIYDISNDAVSQAVSQRP